MLLLPPGVAPSSVTRLSVQVTRPARRPAARARNLPAPRRARPRDDLRPGPDRARGKCRRAPSEAAPRPSGGRDRRPRRGDPLRGIRDLIVWRGAVEGVRNGRVLVAEGTRPRCVRVLVVDGNEVLGNGLRWLLTRVPWVERCSLRGRAAGRLRPRARRRRPRPADVRARSPRPAPGPRCSTSRWDDVSLRTARAAGAHGVIAREAAGARSARRRPLAGPRRRARARRPRGGIVRFTPREREILRLVGAGLTNAEIGAADVPRAGHGQAPHARHLRQARCAQPRRGRPRRTPPGHRRRLPRPVTPSPRTRSACSSPTRSTSVAPASCSRCTAAPGSQPARARARSRTHARWPCA